VGAEDREPSACTRYAVVTITALSAVDPTAQHSGVLEHAMPLRNKIPLGNVCVVHVLPPSVVATTTPPDEEEFCPTAQYSDVLTQAMS
jgi:hypothetical protein